MASPFLDRIIHNRGLTKLFEAHCKQSLVTENWHFYQQVMDYRDIIEPDERIARAQKIYDQYLTESAPEEVNIDQPKRAPIKQRLLSGDPDLFVPLVAEILQTLENDAARKFFTSAIYKENKSKLSSLNARALYEILENPKEKDLFHKYLRSIGENHQLEFYNVLIDFEKIPTQNAKAELLKPKVEYIVEHYIREGAPKQVQLPEFVTMQIIEKLMATKSIDTKIFGAAREHIFSWLADTVAPTYHTLRDKGAEWFILTLQNEDIKKNPPSPINERLNTIKSFLRTFEQELEGELLLKKASTSKEIWQKFWAKVEENSLVFYSSDKLSTKKTQIDLTEATVEFCTVEFVKYAFKISRSPTNNASSTQNSPAPVRLGAGNSVSGTPSPWKGTPGNSTPTESPKVSVSSISSSSSDQMEFFLATKTFAEARSWVVYLKKISGKTRTKSLLGSVPPLPPTPGTPLTSKTIKEDEDDSENNNYQESTAVYPVCHVHSQSKRDNSTTSSSNNSTSTSSITTTPNTTNTTPSSSTVSSVRLTLRDFSFFGLVESLGNAENCKNYIEERVKKSVVKHFTEKNAKYDPTKPAVNLQSIVTSVDETFLERARLTGWTDGASGIFVFIRGDQINWCASSDFRAIYCANGLNRVVTLLPPQKPLSVFGSVDLKDSAVLNNINGLITGEPFSGSFYQQKNPEFIILGNSNLFDNVDINAAAEFVRNLLSQKSLSEVTTLLVQYACHKTNPKGPVRAMIIQLGPILGQNQLNKPDLDDIWEDKTLFMAYREFLYNNFSEENLCFYVTALHFERKIADELIISRARIIYETFISENAAQNFKINLMAEEADKLMNAMKNPHRLVFQPILQKIKNVLKREWWVDFLGSPSYAKIKDGGNFVQYPLERARDRNEVDLYDQLTEDQRDDKIQESNDSESLLESSGQSSRHALERDETDTSELDDKKSKISSKKSTDKTKRVKKAKKKKDLSLDDLLGEIYAANVQLKQEFGTKT